MRRLQLAKILTSTQSAKEARSLLREHPRLCDAKLAWEIKDICYSSWTSDPPAARRAAKALNYLAREAPDDETEALRSWVEGIAELSEGKFESAVASFERSGTIFAGLDNELDAARIQVPKLIALALLGDYDKAITAGEAALKIFKTHGDELSAAKIEMNLSNIVSRREDHRLAEKYCRSAARRFEQLGERRWLAMAQNDLANTYTELFEFDKAEKYYSAGLLTARSKRMTLTEAEIESSLGNLAILRGRYADALRLLEESREKYEELLMPHQQAIAQLEIADLYAELNLLTEAEESYRALIPTLKRLKLRAEEARACLNFGRVLAAAGSHRAARVQFRRAAALYTAEQNPAGSAAVSLAQARIEVALGSYNAAIDIARSVISLPPEKQNNRNLFAALWIEGESLRLAGSLPEAKNALDDLRKRAVAKEQPDLAFAAYTSLGKLARQENDSSAAMKYFKRAADISESLRSPLPGEEFRMSFFAGRLEAHEEISKLYLDLDNPAEALNWIERSRSRALLDAIADGTAAKKTLKQSKTVAALTEKLNWLYLRLERADAADSDKLRREIENHEKEISRQIRREQSKRPARIVRPREKSFIDSDRLRRKIPADHTLIEYVCFDEQLSALVLTKDEIRFVRNIASVSAVRASVEELQFQFGSLRYGSRAVEKFIDALKARSDAYLEKLYDQLIRPIEGIIHGDLIVIPAGPVHYVPFNALRSGGKYLAETRSATTVPSAGIWYFLEERSAASFQKPLLMGFADDRIPLVNSEIDSLAKLFPDSLVFKGQKATLANLLAGAAESDAVHLACHGIFRSDNPMFSSIRLANGWVTVRDICSMELNSKLVTLSACETGLSAVNAGEEILGLARGFLTAGANALILTLWTVNDLASAELMASFYKNLQRGLGVAASLRSSQLEFIARGDHPYFWSPFVLIGK